MCPVLTALSLNDETKVSLLLENLGKLINLNIGFVFLLLLLTGIYSS